jgi:guanylate kinase
MGEEMINEPEDDFMDEDWAPVMAAPMGEKFRSALDKQRSDKEQRIQERKEKVSQEINRLQHLQNVIFDSNIASNSDKIEIIEIIGRTKNRWENSLLTN